MKDNRLPVIRTPSRLYHHVYTSTPISENNFSNDSIIGPEFVVRSQDEPKEIKLKAANNEKIKNLRKILVILLSGQRIKLQCNPLVTSLEKIFQAVINEEKITFSHYLSLAFMCKGEFHFPDLKTKIYKVAPTGWDNNKNIVMIESFTLYLRFLCYPRIENPRYLPSNFTNMLYLQLRHDFIEGRIYVSMPTMLSLASLTLQAEFGNSSKEQAEGYFFLEHYLPESAHNGDENKECTLEKELILLHRSLKLSPDMAKAQYISRIHGTLSYGNLIYLITEEKQRKQLLLVVSSDGLKLLPEPPSFERLLEADLVSWPVIKKVQISVHRLTVISKNKTKMKKIKMSFTDNRYKYVWNVCNYVSRWQQKQFGLASAYYENSINNATQKNLFKSNSEMNLHQINGITNHPEANPLFENRDNENTNNLNKTELSASCLNLTEREYFLPRRRLSSVYQTSEQFDSRQNDSRELRSFETTEYPDSSGNSCLMKMKSPKPNVVTYFPSEASYNPVKAIKKPTVPLNIDETNLGTDLPEVNNQAILNVKSGNVYMGINSTSVTESTTNVSYLKNKSEMSVNNTSESIYHTPAACADKSFQVQLSTLIAKKSLFQNNIDRSAKASTSKIQLPTVVCCKCSNEKTLNSTLSPLKRSVTNVKESLQSNGVKRSSTIIKVTSFRDTSSESRFQNDNLLRKNFRSTIAESEDISDSDFSPYSSPKKTSIGVKMGTKVTTAILQKYKLSYPGQSPSTKDMHNAIVIEPSAADVASPVHGQEESLDESLVKRFLAVPSPECGLAERKLMTVSLTRSEGSLGITILPAVDGYLYIGELAPGSPAFNDGVLKPGDRLMGVNGFSVENLSCERAVSLLKSSQDPIQLLVSQPIEETYFQDSLLEIETPNKYPDQITGKHVTIIKVSTEPSSSDYFSANSLSPSEPISV